MTDRLYGIANCDRCRAARRWLDARGMEYRFHDLRRDGLTAETLSRWIDALGPEAIVNRRSTTWRGLDATEREAAGDPARVIELLLRHPTLIRRPLLETGDGRVIQGFEAALYERELGRTA